MNVEIDLIVECDRKMIRNYICIYAAVAVVTVAVVFYLNYNPLGRDASSKLLENLMEALTSSLAIPVAMLHLKRKNALTPFLVMRMRGQQYSPGDPGCDALRSLVDEALKKRMEA